MQVFGATWRKATLNNKWEKRGKNPGGWQEGVVTWAADLLYRFIKVDIWKVDFQKF